MGRRRKVALSAAAMTLLALGAGSAEAAKLESPKFAAAEIKRAAEKALASGARPQKLRRASPAWFTSDLRRRLAADADGVMLAPVDAPLPGEIGIRPGSWMIAPYWCTMNFVFQSRGTLAIGTAGHCVDNSRPVLLTLAPSSGVPVLVELGRAAQARCRHRAGLRAGRDPTSAS